MATNVVFGLLRMAVLAVAVAPGPIVGYDIATVATYVWLGQGLMSVVVLYADKHLAERIRNGDVVVDLYRPWHLQRALFADDLGRTGYAVLVRLVPPVAFGALFFPFRWPDVSAVPLFVVSTLLAVTVSFGMRFMVNAITFWLLDNRGVHSLYTVTTWLLCGLSVPLTFFPDWAKPILWSTPFPAMLQAPIDVFLEHGSPWPILANQAFWAVTVFVAGHVLLGRAVHKVVVQGG
ncbi:ABC transporter permease [Saccharothrix deserti]|uniref:ABC transporter permease n=1 Tax=Saccharothrix deserti TaxID=2593674 RepID=UPI001EE4AC5A|nr:ABC-2 family transporter protein [Saccharothrix deserti]